MSTPASLKKFGLLMSGWHSSSGDPIYAVGSFFVSGKDYPDLAVVRSARAGLLRCREDVKEEMGRRHAVWTPQLAERQRELRGKLSELDTIVAFLRRYASPRAKQKSGGGARVTKAQIEEAGHAAFRKAYTAGANIPEAQRAAVEAETALGGVRARVTLERVPLNGGYTREGRYFGVGAPLYSYDVWTMRGTNESGFLRAHDRASAFEKIYKLFPDLRPKKRK